MAGLRGTPHQAAQGGRRCGGGVRSRQRPCGLVPSNSRRRRCGGRGWSGPVGDDGGGRGGGRACVGGRRRCPGVKAARARPVQHKGGGRGHLRRPAVLKGGRGRVRWSPDDRRRPPRPSGSGGRAHTPEPPSFGLGGVPGAAGGYGGSGGARRRWGSAVTVPAGVPGSGLTSLEAWPAQGGAGYILGQGGGRGRKVGAWEIISGDGGGCRPPGCKHGVDRGPPRRLVHREG
ncbi:uncharacterized protein LOC109706054 [Ananas comosus]|uniref:Uncharacterized protein LOC109706054 n=1 Tax=Ananas comosus TaxID=4615 RepID=A0A6P5EM46_ANACO|nr:uncharacterized protein LOC109706054 [Ananas comosus]